MISEAVFGGIVSKVINDCVDISKGKIKKVIEDKSTKHQTLESQIYNLTVDALYDIADEHQKNNQDKIYEAAESLLKGFFHADVENAEVIRTSLRRICSYKDDDIYMKFKMVLFQKLSDEYGDLYRKIRLLQEEKESSKASGIEKKVDILDQKVDQGFQEIYRKLSEGKTNNRQSDDGKSENRCNKDIRYTLRSRTHEYADKWNQNMFLNDFDEWDENAGENVKLKDVYLEEHLPHFLWGENKQVSTDLKALLSRYMAGNNENEMLLILGQPGIGKSTLITWITAHFTDRYDDILVYRFASDLGNIEWKGGISNRIVEELGLEYSDLNGKVLILDGFDEVSVGDDRRGILDSLYGDLVYKNIVKNFMLIITCRENYISGFGRMRCKYILLQPWDEAQMESFCRIFQEKTRNHISESTLEKLLENKEILGIPLILYMVLALHISIEKEGSIVDVYDKIFSLEGGIYDRCIDNKNFADPHRIGEIKKQIHQLSREIAMWMFENRADEAYISREEYQKICSNMIPEQQKNEKIEQDLLIGNFFKLVKHCEGVGTEELYFVHRSIYEYFVVETIYSSIEDAMMKLTEESQEELAENIAFYLKEGEISPTIGKNLGYKILKRYEKLDDERKQRFYQWWESAVGKMMEAGMFYYTKRNIQEYKNITKKEGRCFLNLLEILRMLLPITDRKYIMESIDRRKISDYIGLSEWGNYSKVFLKGADLRGKRLHECNLGGACFQGADLRRADLIGANLYEADLTKADLRGAELCSMRFNKIILREAIFDERQMVEIEDGTYDLQNIKIYIEKEDRFISHEEYRKRSKRNNRRNGKRNT